jgi:hypothetical protein
MSGKIFNHATCGTIFADNDKWPPFPTPASNRIRTYEVSMKRIFFGMLFMVSVLAVPLSALAQSEEPTIYVIEKGDTLWGLSNRFLNDPYYWPDLWARNPEIANPHFIYPGQRVRIYPDRIEIEPAPVATATPTTKVAPAKRTAEEVVPARTFHVNGSEGFLLEKSIVPTGHIIATQDDRKLLGDQDLVYTDIGTRTGARQGDLFTIFKQMEPVSHPVTNEVMGYRIDQLGTLKLAELEKGNSKAIITRSYKEIGAGSYLMPYQAKKRAVALKAADRNLEGYIVSTRDGNISVGAGDIAYLDLGKRQGLQPGNLLYVVRDVVPEKVYTDRRVGELPKDVIGAIVVVDIGENTSTGLIVKSVESLHKGDKVKLTMN